MVIHERQKMLTFVQCPILRSELSEQRMIDLKHVHTVEAGMQALVALIICYGMQHFIIHDLIVITVQCLSQ